MRHTIEGKVFNKLWSMWEDTELNVFKDNKWESVENITLWKQRVTPIEYENKEIGAYITWYDDPSNSVMLHYQTIDDSPVECLYRKEGLEEWQTVDLFADKPFPLTEKHVRWFKLQDLEPDTIYETKLKNHRDIHRFKTMPSDFIRNIKATMVSDQMNSEENFKTEGEQGFNTMHNNDIDVILIAGDGVHDNGLKHEAWTLFWEKYFQIERERNLMLPFIYAFGNHDGRVNNEDGTFKSLLWYTGGARKKHVVFPYNFFSNLNDVGYGTVNISDYLSFVFLNSGHTEKIEGVQTTWLENTLQLNQGRQIFPFLHVAPYPAYSGYNSYNNKRVRDYWTPLFTEYGVKLAGCGHEHVHLVTKKVTGDNLDVGGVVYTGHGHGMGNITRPNNIPPDTWYVDFMNNTQRGFDIIEFKPNGEIELNKVSLIGEIMYQKTL